MVQQDLAREEEYSAAVICLEAAGNRKLLLHTTFSALFSLEARILVSPPFHEFVYV